MFVCVLSLRIAPLISICQGHSRECIRVSRIELQGTVEFLNCQIMIPGVLMNIPKRYKCEGNPIVQCRGLFAILLRALKPLEISIQFELQHVHLGKPRKSKRKAAVRIHCTLQGGDGAVEVSGLVESLDIAESCEIVFVSRAIFASCAPSDKLPSNGDVHQPSKTRHGDRKSTRLNSSHVAISYAVFCLKKKK